MLEIISLIPIVGPTLATLLPFVIVIAIVVAVHEYGHYIVGRWCGIHAEVFSIGFGRELIGRVDKRGTRWRISALPLGGYVRFQGDMNAASVGASNLTALDAQERRRSFAGAPLWARSATIAAGPVANFILSIVVYTGFVMAMGVSTNEPVIGEIPASVVAETPLQSGDRVLSVDGAPVETFTDLLLATSDGPGPYAVSVERDGSVVALSLNNPRPPLVVGVRPLSAASRAGIEADDLILAVDGTPTPDFDSLKALVTAAEGQEIQVSVRRGDTVLSLPMRPTLQDVQLADGSYTKQVIIGVSIRSYLTPLTETPGIFAAMGYGAQQTWSVVTNSLDGIRQVIVGNVSAENLQGPVGIAQVSGETAQRSGVEFIALIAL
ncbi:MAG: RIP metalloprotease RseP, partial [Pseudomonadota bacterium]